MLHKGGDNEGKMCTVNSVRGRSSWAVKGKGYRCERYRLGTSRIVSRSTLSMDHLWERGKRS